MALLTRIAAVVESTPPEAPTMALPFILFFKSFTVSSMNFSALNILGYHGKQLEMNYKNFIKTILYKLCLHRLNICIDEIFGKTIKAR